MWNTEYNNDIKLELESTMLTVPNNDVARLMYYLNSVCTTIDCYRDPEIQNFARYDNWSYMSIVAQTRLIALCMAFSPDVLHNRVFFLNDKLCGENTNKFHMIHQVRHQLPTAVESISIGDKVWQVTEVMTYKSIWLKTNYFDPLPRLIQKLKSIPTPPRVAVKTAEPPTTTPIFHIQPVMQRPPSPTVSSVSSYDRTPTPVPYIQPYKPPPGTTTHVTVSTTSPSPGNPVWIRSSKPYKSPAGIQKRLADFCNCTLRCWCCVLCCLCCVLPMLSTIISLIVSSFNRL